MTENVAVLKYYKYVGGPGSQSVYSTRYFCGSCRRGIGGVHGSACYGFPEYPEDLEAENESGRGSIDRISRNSERSLEYFSFCPWCGIAFEDEWSQDRTIQNERAIDHYQNPGTHKGDSHEFRGDGPNCMANHWLSQSGGDRLCWCDPEVEPGIMGCVIRHQDKDYAEVMAVEQAERDQAEAAAGHREEAW